MQRPIQTLILLAACAALLGACASRKSAPADLSARGLTAPASADYYFLLYQELSRQGQARQAAEVLQKLIAVAPTPELYRDLANIHWGLGEQDKTREVLEHGIAAFPDEKVLRFYLANSYLLQRRFDDAAQVLANYLSQHPKDQSGLQELAAVLVEAGRFQQALDFLAQVPRDRRTPAMSYYESKALSGLGKRKQAMEKLRQALREDPNLLAAWSELAFYYEQNNDFRQAEEAYRRILDLGEDGPELWLRLIRLALKQKNEAKAVQFLEKAPVDRAFLFEVMSLFVEEGFQEGAAKVMERLAQDQPGNPDVIFLQAMMAVERERDLDKALALLSQIPKTHKFYDKALSTRIQLALDAGRFDLAAPLVSEARGLLPDRIEFLFLEAVLNDKQGNLERTVALYREAVARWPDSAEALYRLAVSLERSKQRAEAMRIMEDVLLKDPANPDALNFVGYGLAEEERDLDRALELVTRALQANPTSPYYLDSLAWVHFKRKDLKAAWQDIQRAVAGNVDDPAIWEHYGDIAKAMGNRKEAAKGYSKALEMKAVNAPEIQKKLESLK
ncbi:Beta-barrel assembly-enhancing protease [Fundidesulfovibrio magnetotacticus]|uniref:Beta-barrel assembly-enhancing protease n=1 Tax=Fundidesulfovibrio magnetotacticus TaxID=2730080 RepID=A0A6V8LY27_9BACT|nr:tetratricopeptide repeat protein [Fundidesulfovibrio magnetotacticus]GFK95501.1 Beta-barrel assembly-enhancing protease [Fundidesulfovibrio magnetotacticus]